MEDSTMTSGDLATQGNPVPTDQEGQTGSDSQSPGRVSASQSRPISSDKNDQNGAASDNPLDAPVSPKPQNEQTEPEDEEMGGTEPDGGKETGQSEPTGAAASQVDGPSDAPGDEAKTTAETSARSNLVSQTHAIILPSYTSWFDMNIIHDMEKKALPEFFNNRNRSKTPSVYKDYRDFMINTYRLNPVEYLTVTACRRNLAGDVCAIMRVHSFLENWGLINYQVEPSSRPSNIGPPFTGHFRIIADTPRGLQPFQPAPKAFVTPGKPHPSTEKAAAAAPPVKADLNLEIRRNIFDDKGKEVTSDDKDKQDKQTNGDKTVTNGTSTDYSAKGVDGAARAKQIVNCHSCGVDCTRIRFHYSKSAPVSTSGNPADLKYDLCPTCFLQGRLPASHQASDFVKMEDSSYTTIPDRDRPWSDSETLLLLEALENFDDDWRKVERHVRTRTAEECVMKFLQLEIEPNYIDDSAENDPLQQALMAGRDPISQLENPILSVIAHLAQLAEPTVTAAAAGRSIEEIRRSMRKQLEKGSTEETSPEEKPVEKDRNEEAPRAEDSMEIDTANEGESTAVVSSSSKEKKSTPSIPSIAIATSAARAGALASHEEREMTRLVGAAVNITLQKFELKLAQFTELEQILDAERKELEIARQQLFLDRMALKNRIKEVQDAFQAISLEGPEAAAVKAAEVRTLGQGAEQYQFQAPGAQYGTVQPLSAAGGDYKAFEL
ncbi:SWIRM domain containing protein [Coccidioides posadasii C735 delta SOWgp]|uniref:SWIRM domain containing protein n=1 Tax=Coccidioides posadasii (strain C735) TaxID=222929 RepID=C5PBT8_COCP7|nr:SWIRM domain containing protein [Coccidioides posadasii C735 delta SOWgp]EER25415.1 SWIRM domain containing protein [Coccidioides posadasii C735 delta SOWgp]|eukprot:XP_003067560.1 SWIRM domain containing protein [Coccidioides posadasii C735 delta SOWgp]